MNQHPLVNFPAQEIERLLRLLRGTPPTSERIFTDDAALKRFNDYGLAMHFFGPGADIHSNPELADMIRQKLGQRG